MQRWIISANGHIYNHAAAFARFGYIDWKQRAKYAVGDEVYIYCTKPYQRIMYKTVVEFESLPFERCTDDRDFWYDTTIYENGRSGRYARLKLIAQADDDNLSLEFLCKNGLNAAPQGPVKVSEELSRYLDRFLNDYQPGEIFSLDLPEACYEGVKYQIAVNRYERSSVARRKCIEAHGARCSVCGLDFEERYGDLGKGFIHIHHIVPLSSIGQSYKVDYAKDLIPVCPNCHYMLHRGQNGKVLTVEELKKIMKRKE